MMDIYEAWGLINEKANTFANVAGCKHLQDIGLMEEGHIPLYSLKAESWTEAMTIYHEIQGWEPYKPMT